METEKQGIPIFHIAAPHYWNSLLDDACNIEQDLNDFKKSAFIGVAQ